MKKVTLLLLTCFALLATSCTKNNNVVAPNETYFIEVKGSDWKTSDGGKTFSANYSVPAITSDVNTFWGVLLYARFSPNVYEQLPETYDGISYSYSHSTGVVTVDIQSSDGVSVITPPGSFTMKLVLVPSN